MKQTVSEYDFCEAFRKLRPDSFSYEGIKALYEYLCDYEDSIGEETELDVIAFCCEFSEYPSALDCADGYGFDPGLEDEEEREEAALRWLQDQTSVIEFNGGIIIQDF